MEHAAGRRPQRATQRLRQRTAPAAKVARAARASGYGPDYAPHASTKVAPGDGLRRFGPSSAFIRMTSDGSNSRTTTISAAASQDISPVTTVQTLQDKRRHFGRGAACPKPRPNVALGPVNIEMACTLFERPPPCCRLSAAHSAGDGRSARRRWQDSPRPVRVLIATRHATSSVVVRQQSQPGVAEPWHLPRGQARLPTPTSAFRKIQNSSRRRRPPQHDPKHHRHWQN